MKINHTRRGLAFAIAALLALSTAGTAWAYIERSSRPLPARVNGTTIGTAMRIQGFSHEHGNGPGDFWFRLETWDAAGQNRVAANSVGGRSRVAFFKWNASRQKAEVCFEESISTGGLRKGAFELKKTYPSPPCGQGYYILASCSESLMYVKASSTPGNLSTVGWTTEDCSSPLTFLYSLGGWHPWCSPAACGSAPP
jgi:hypothetical protein